MTEPSSNVPLPASLVWLRRLVMGLTGVMILGMALLVGTLLVKLNNAPPALTLPAEYALPEGEAQSFSVTPDWVLVVSEAGRLVVFERASGRIIRQIDLRE